MPYQAVNTPSCAIFFAVRAAMSLYQTNRASGVRTVTTCGDPSAGSPPGSTLLTTLTGVSSAHNTSSARSAAVIASSNPAVASTGRLPCEANRIAAALTFGPYTTAPACPTGGAAVLTLRQQPQRRRDST